MVHSVSKAFAFLALSSLSLSVMADLYVGASAGSTEYPKFAEDVNSIELSAGVRLSDSFALEIAWLELGETRVPGSNNANSRFGIDGTSLALYTFLPLTAELHLFGKFGVYFWDIETNSVTSQAIFRSNSDDAQDSDLILGGGLTWNLSDNIALKGQYQQVDIAGDNIENMSVGITYSF